MGLDDELAGLQYSDDDRDDRSITSHEMRDMRSGFKTGSKNLMASGASMLTDPGAGAVAGAKVMARGVLKISRSGAQLGASGAQLGASGAQLGANVADMGGQKLKGAAQAAPGIVADGLKSSKAILSDEVPRVFFEDAVVLTRHDMISYTALHKDILHTTDLDIMFVNPVCVGC